MEIKLNEIELVLRNRFYNIKRRCYDTSFPAYQFYGAKGVTVCDEWLKDPFKFIKWSLDNGYEEGLVIDKDILCNELSIEPKIYSPKTCKWITHKENCNNKSDNRMLVYADEEKTLSDWCSVFNICIVGVHGRLNRGWNIEDALEVEFSKEKKIYQIDKKTKKVINKYPSVLNASKETGILKSSISKCANGQRKTAGGFCWEFKEKERNRLC